MGTSARDITYIYHDEVTRVLDCTCPDLNCTTCMRSVFSELDR